CQYCQGDYLGAAASFQKSGENDPTNYDAFLWTGYSLFKAEKFEDASVAFQSAARLRPGDFDANIWRAICLARVLRWEEAIPNLEEALKKKPGDTYARFLLFASYAATGQIAKAASLHLIILPVVSVLLLLSYLSAMAVLLGTSLQRRPRREPGIRFA